MQVKAFSLREILHPEGTEFFSQSSDAERFFSATLEA